MLFFIITVIVFILLMKNTISWIAQIISAAIMVQTLFYKFSAAPESVYIFSTIGLEPWGRVGTGVLELIASILLLIPSMASIGAFLGAGLMSGAIFFHLAYLGISVQGDGGNLFAMAVITLGFCLVVLILRKHQIPVIGKNL